ncbi:MAG: peptidase [Roseitalea sp.]|jgi:putative iron-regulated protein|nr:peptidase [Roseitalea sp.]MBO6722092.1 peptidase [Roseitalea sp.]MBO6741712.1 peptidase [Roseitalea sp.]
MRTTSTHAAALMLSSALGIVAAQAETTPEAVAAHYADIALAKYADSLETARALDAAIDALIAEPSAEALAAAKDAWLAARVPYQQTEVYRFGNAIVDDWEGRVNAWPLDEGLIDYVDASYGTENDENTLYTANVIANETVTVNGEAVDASAITPDLISSTLHEAGEVEANVASGYHAIEFLLWGQDLNGTDAGAGERPWSDYAAGDDCTNGNCERRGEYLSAASDLLIADLEEMVANWETGGEARGELMADPQNALSIILTGMGSLSYGELAGERMKLGLLLHDPEEEHDCFADNTHNSHRYNAVGINNVYNGVYTRLDGTQLSGPAISELVAAADTGVDEELRAKLMTTIEKMDAMAARAETIEAYDQMIGEGNEEGNAVVQAAIDGLIDQTRSIERAVAALDLGSLEFEGSDSLDNPNAVFQ